MSANRQSTFLSSLNVKNRPQLRLALRIVLWTLTIAYFCFAGLILTLRYAVLPQIENYRVDIEQLISKAIDRPISIRQIKAHWEGFRPTLTLNGFAIRDAQGEVALGFEQVEAELSWLSLFHLQPRLARIELDAPNLLLRRDTTGRLFVASMEVTPQPDDQAGFTDWLLLQERILIRNATITWIDELRQAPPLSLRKLNLQLNNNGSRHRFGVTAEPPRELAAALDLRGDFKAADFAQIDTWQGEAYAELSYADLAGWKPWIDYPVSLSQGSGGLRLWLGFAQKQITAITADIRLADVRLKLRSDLPELALTRLDGRLGGKREDAGFEIAALQLSLTTADGVVIQPTDLTLAWQTDQNGQPTHGNAHANRIDLDALVRLASHFPLANEQRDQLARYAPHGRFFDLELTWKNLAAADKSFAPKTWRIAGRFEGLGLAPIGEIPGVSNFSGRIDGNEKGGKLMLNTKSGALELPTLFAEAKIGLDVLDAEFDWKSARDGLYVSLKKASFSNPDAAGEFSGTWRELADGPGEIDLAGQLTRARGETVWRYLPYGVGLDTPVWLKGSLNRGTVSDTRFKVKGNLREFPFRSVQGESTGGILEVRGRFNDAALRFAPDWPEITDIEGEMLFVNQRMTMSAKRGKMFGVEFVNVTAEIADLELENPTLVVSGKGSGPTADFLRFIEDSPVGEQIDHFTEDMKAEGRGDLDIKLSLPLQTLEKGKVAGSYRFDGNKLKVDADLPYLTDVRGQLNFTTDDLDAKGITGKLFGAPLVVDIKSAGAGNVQVLAAGEITVGGLRQQLNLPLFDHLSGGFKWTGQVRARKKTAEVKISSNLVGLSSSLPEPFNKSASEAMAFNFERKPPPEPPRGRGAKPLVTEIAQRDLIEMSLGRAARLQLVRQHDVAPPRVVRGLIALGESAAAATPLPERSLNIAINMPKLNVDFWRKAFDPPSPKESGSKAAVTAPLVLPALPGLQFDLRSNELKVQDKNFHDLRLSGGRPDATANTRFELKSRELAGNFEWNGTGKGKLSGRIAQFSIPANAMSADNLPSSASDVVKQLPALDITVDQLALQERPLGTVRVTGENRGDYWHSKIDVKNDDGTLEVIGRWRPSLTEPDTQVDIKLAAKSIERLLNRAGYHDAMRRGTANVSASLSWNGAPFAIDYASLNGKLTLAASNGQFSKLEPGVGRLLGILSLQSLPRRITLDFRDIFSQGFAFDRIDGEFTIARGSMDTLAPNNLRIIGPAAKVVMDGTIHLGDETQSLHVRIQPTVGESIAVGTMLANPVVGAAVWAAQKLLNDPFGQAFAFDYMISGNWADPKVEKLSATKSPEFGTPVKPDETLKK